MALLYNWELAVSWIDLPAESPHVMADAGDRVNQRQADNWRPTDMKANTSLRVLAVSTSIVIVAACQNGPTAPTAFQTVSTAPVASQESHQETLEGPSGEPTGSTTTSSMMASTILRPGLPKPVITRLGQTSAAPGVTISIHGRDLNPQGRAVLVSPKVVFAGAPGQYFQRSVQVVSNNELRVVVPPGRGSASVQVQTAGGSSGNLHFTYKSPTITGISPGAGPRGQSVTITGTGFGVKEPLDLSSVKFGDSLTQPAQWMDHRIVVKAPMDFGSGLNSDILLSLLGCISSFGATSALETWTLHMSLPGCKTLVESAYQRFQLSRSPGFVTKNVGVTVQTSAGTSNARTFTYRVQANTR